MLSVVPGGKAQYRQVIMWKKMKPMEPSMFKSFWNMVSMTKTAKGWAVDPMTDPENAEYDEWTDRHGHDFKGMRRKIKEFEEIENRNRLI